MRDIEFLGRHDGTVIKDNVSDERRRDLAKVPNRVIPNCGVKID